MNTLKEISLKLELFDVSGKLISTEEVKFSSDKNIYSLNTSEFAKGIYQLKMSGDVKDPILIKIIKD